MPERKASKTAEAEHGKAAYSFVSPKPHKVGDAAATCGLCIHVLSPSCPAEEFMTSVYDSS